MTKQLTIKTLSAIRDVCKADHMETEAEALDMAIKALEQPVRCKDCKYSEEDEDEHGIVERWCRIWADICTNDGYCNYAERRTDD